MNLAVVGLLESGDQTQRRAFATAAWTEETKKFTVVNFKAKSIDNSRGPVVAAQAVNLEDAVFIRAHVANACALRWMRGPEHLETGLAKILVSARAPRAPVWTIALFWIEIPRYRYPDNPSRIGAAYTGARSPSVRRCAARDRVAGASVRLGRIW